MSEMKGDIPNKGALYISEKKAERIRDFELCTSVHAVPHETAVL
jgi:hypothetical protein